MASQSPNIVILPGLCGLDELCTRCKMMVNPNHKKLCEKFYNLAVKNFRGETKCYFCDMKFKFKNKAYHHIKLKHFSKKVVIVCKKLSNETLDEFKIPVELENIQSQRLLPQFENDNVNKQQLMNKKKVRKKLFATPDLKMKKQKIVTTPDFKKEPAVIDVKSPKMKMKKEVAGTHPKKDVNNLENELLELNDLYVRSLVYEFLLRNSNTTRIACQYEQEFGPFKHYSKADSTLEEVFDIYKQKTSFNIAFTANIFCQITPTITNKLSISISSKEWR